MIEINEGNYLGNMGYKILYVIICRKCHTHKRLMEPMAFVDNVDVKVAKAKHVTFYMTFRSIRNVLRYSENVYEQINTDCEEKLWIAIARSLYASQLLIEIN